MLVLGIADGQTSGACVVGDGRILSAVNEERMARQKQARGFPWKSIDEALRLAGASPKDVDVAAVSDRWMMLREEVDGWPGWFEARAEGRDGVKDFFFRMASMFGGIAPFLPGVRNAYYLLRMPSFAHRRKRIGEILRDKWNIQVAPRFVHHHYGHAASAYYTSGFDEALVVTMDGGGDRDCSHVYSARDGLLQKLSSSSSYDSLGNYYAYVTALCGYKAKRHEGKITGLAARGEPIYVDLFESMIGFSNGKLVNRGRVLFNKALATIEARLPKGWKHADLAASIQLVSERVACALVEHWQRETGHHNVALAGGLFANVRINECILRVKGVKNVSVHPGMSDEGLAVGAALAVYQDDARKAGKPYEAKLLPHACLGTEIKDADAESVLRAAGLEFTKPKNTAAHVAQLLHEGHVVARASGAMEYGPRALGNRTIMYRPDDHSVNDWLNTLLRRTEFMPFAPASTYESAADLYIDPNGALETARFMTITLHCKPIMRKRCEGVVHVDGTARPQLVRREDNPGFYDIITEYEKLSGLPAIINTSFNIHEEPIVRTAKDAVRAFLDSKLDYLVLGPFVAVGPVGSAETRACWKAQKEREPVSVGANG